MRNLSPDQCLYSLTTDLPLNISHPQPSLKLHLAGFDDEKSLLMSQRSLEKIFGQPPVFIQSTLMENGGLPQYANPTSLLKEAIHVISCGYEDKSEWGKEVC